MQGMRIEPTPAPQRPAYPLLAAFAAALLGGCDQAQPVPGEPPVSADGVPQALGGDVPKLIDATDKQPETQNTAAKKADEEPEQPLGGDELAPEPR